MVNLVFLNACLTHRGFFAQGDSFEEARENLRDAMEGNVILALQLGFEIPHLKGIEIKKRDVQTSTS